MSRLGYRKLEESLLNENEQLRQGTASEIDMGVSEPPFPPTCHQKMEDGLNEKIGYI